VYWFSRKQRAAQGAFLRGDDIVFRNDGAEEIVLPRDEVPLPEPITSRMSWQQLPQRESPEPALERSRKVCAPLRESSIA